jgi:hypothetical protein
LEPGLPVHLVAEMRRQASAACPVPPAMAELDGIWWVGAFGTVVAVEQPMVVVRPRNPTDWPRDKLHLLMRVSDRSSNQGIKGDAVVVGNSGDLPICRFFQRPHYVQELPALGDQTWVDHSTSRAMRDEWRTESASLESK